MGKKRKEVNAYDIKNSKRERERVHFTMSISLVVRTVAARRNLTLHEKMEKNNNKNYQTTRRVASICGNLFIKE